MQRPAIVRRTAARAAALTAAAVAAAALVIGVGGRSVSLAATSACKDSTSPTLGYTVTVCITVQDGTLTGSVPVTATVFETGPRQIQRGIFLIDATAGTDHKVVSKYLLSDFEGEDTAPNTKTYRMTLDTRRWGDGSHTIGAQAFMTDDAPATCVGGPPCDAGWATDPATATRTFSNGFGVPPPNTRTFTPKTYEPPAGQPLVVVAVGDGASGETNSKAVVNLVATMNPNLVLYPGDVYQFGSPTEFDNFFGFGDPTGFGRFRDITNPAIGNHEYFPGTKNALGYFDYWDNVPHYYSFNSGGWHFVSLDSTSQYNQMSPGTVQYEWFKQDLTANPLACTLVMFHHPMFNIGEEGPTARVQPVWDLMAQHGVDIAMLAHDHDYQRWIPLDAAGVPSLEGVTEFIVGTGGRGIPQKALTADPRAVLLLEEYGALRLEMTPTGATFVFKNTKNQTLDQGAIPCSGPRHPDPVLPPPPPPTTTTTTPTVPTTPTITTTVPTTTLPGQTVPTTPTTPGPTTTTNPVKPPTLAVRLPKRRFTVRPRGRIALHFTIGKAAKVTAEFRRAGKLVLRISARAPRGKSTFELRAPGRPGTYVLLVRAQAGAAKGLARGVLIVRRPTTP